MVQQKAAMYVAKRFADQVLSSPKATAETDEAVPETAAAPVVATKSAPAAPVDLGLHGQVITDEAGQPLGTAIRLQGMAVYVVTDGYRYHPDDLTRALGEPSTRLFLHEDDGQVTGLIYVPDPADLPPRIEGTRADDV